MELALAYPYSLGLVAAFNPCGFVLLPAYLAYFLGLDPVSSSPVSSSPASSSGTSSSGADDETSSDAGGIRLLAVVLQALAVGLTLTAGFVAVFGAFGVLFETILSQGAVLERIGYVTIAVGVGMAVLGVVMLTGRQINLRLPKMSRGTGGRNLASVFMFGVSYAVVSLSCTIGLFIAATTATLTDQNFLDGVANFIAYGVGMGSVITFLTLALALARTNAVHAMRKALRWVNQASGLILVAAGVYLVNYGWWELQLRSDSTADNALVNWFIDLQVEVNTWIQHTTPQRIGALCAFGVAGALLLGWRQAEPSAVRRRAVTAAYAAAWLIVEFGFNRGDFTVLPVLRFVAGWPERTARWLSDPLRFGVVAELAFTAAVLWLLWRSVRRVFPRGSRSEALDSPVGLTGRKG